MLMLKFITDGVKAGGFAKVKKGAVGVSNEFVAVNEEFPSFRIYYSFLSIEDALQGDSFNNIGADKLSRIRILGLKPRIVPLKGDISTLQDYGTFLLRVDSPITCPPVLKLVHVKGAS